MTLLSYDHCPYCVKARMIFGLKSIPFELKNLLNDDESTPIQLIGKKMLPILIKDNNEPLAESLDIISYVDQLSEYGPKRVNPAPQSASLSQWLQEIRQYHYALAMPRWVKMGLDEFATPSAVKYFTDKKEMSIGAFDHNFKNSESLIIQANQHLKVLDKLIVASPYFWGDEVTWDDFHVFSALRCLTTTQGVEFPEKINDYMNQLSSLSQVPLHWERAI
jgi:glutaredoxin 2